MTLERVNPEPLGRPIGFSHGMLAPPGARVLFVAGQTARMETSAPPGFVEQFASALDQVLAVVREAGGATEDIARMTVYVADMGAYSESRALLGEVWRERMGRHYPAMSVVGVAELFDPGALVEIEATAAISQEGSP